MVDTVPHIKVLSFGDEAKAALGKSEQSYRAGVFKNANRVTLSHGIGEQSEVPQSDAEELAEAVEKAIACWKSTSAIDGGGVEKREENQLHTKAQRVGGTALRFERQRRRTTYTGDYLHEVESLVRSARLQSRQKVLRYARVRSVHTFIARSGASDVHMAAVVLHFPGKNVQSDTILSMVYELRDTNDAFLLYLAEAITSLVQSVSLFPYNWSAWLKIVELLDGEDEVRISANA
ncbi:Anaphase-promoting complex subunit 8 [Cystobasidiomycetes sp. EMM_F5]